MKKTLATLTFALGLFALSTSANADWSYHSSEGTYFGYENGNTTTIIGPGGTDFIYHY